MPHLPHRRGNETESLAQTIGRPAEWSTVTLKMAERPGWEIDPWTTVPHLLTQP